MAKVLLDNIEIGMELSSDVVDRQGRVLLKAGIELSEKHIRVFNTWGVLEVDVIADTETEVLKKDYSPELIAEAEKYIANHFQHNDLSHPVIKSLVDYCQIQYIENKAS